MSTSLRRLVFVHAHPDDECMGTGGTIARYSAEGAHVCLVTCTNGELGEIAELPEFGDVGSIRVRLGEVRIEELREACRRLGEVDLRLLGYRDSGMAGTPGNEDPSAFVNQDFDGAVGKLVAVLRSVRPQVLVTYNAFGLYGHPDHIRAHDVAMAAVDAAMDASFAPEAGPAHEVSKVYHTAISRSFLMAARVLSKEMGFGEDDFVSESDVDLLGTPDDEVTTEIDGSAFVREKFLALEAHRTQLGTTERLLQIPEEVRAMAMGTEHYVLVRPPGRAASPREKDLFEGLNL